MKGPIKARTRIVRQLFEHIDADNASMAQIGNEAGIERKMVSYWRAGRHTPRADLLSAMAEAAGYELVLRRKEE